jgi:hypothetical protein
MTTSVTHIFDRMRRHLQVPFFMDIIILMAWSIWTIRNDWIFNGIDPSVERCKAKFVSEFSLILLRVRPDSLPRMEHWLLSL